MFGCNAGSEAVVAASRRGFTEELVGRGCCPGGYSLCGVCAPVPIGVERFDGSSDVKMVAEEGDIRYLVLSVASKASLNPETGSVYIFASVGVSYLELYNRYPQ
jgi:hypothetical protein